MSHAKATGFLLKEKNTSNKYFCNLGPAQMTLFNETPSVVAEQSNTMRTLVVVLPMRTTRK